MANFPIGPAVNDTVNFGSTQWRYDGQGWVRGSFTAGAGGITMERVDYVMLLTEGSILTSAMVAPYQVDYL